MPDVIHTRNVQYAPHIEDYITDVVPTTTVKKAFRLNTRVGTGSLNILLGSTFIGAGSILRFTFLDFKANRQALFIMTSSVDGTIHHEYVQSAGGVAYLGDPFGPVHSTRGTINFYGGSGSFGLPVGTYLFIANYEGIAYQHRSHGFIASIVETPGQ